MISWWLFQDLSSSRWNEEYFCFFQLICWGLWYLAALWDAPKILCRCLGELWKLGGNPPNVPKFPSGRLGFLKEAEIPLDLFTSYPANNEPIEATNPFLLPIPPLPPPPTSHPPYNYANVHSVKYCHVVWCEVLWWHNPLLYKRERERETHRKREKERKRDAMEK